MKQMRKFITAISILVSMLFAANANVIASTAKFNKIWLEHNVNHDGQKCLAIHFAVQVDGMRGRLVEFIAFVDSPKGVGHPDANNNYCNSNGNVVSTKKSDCIYESCVWQDFVIYLPNSEVHPKAGTNTYYIRVFAYDGSAIIGNSEFVSFEMTGSSDSGYYSNVQGERRTYYYAYQYTIDDNGVMSKEKHLEGWGYYVSFLNNVMYDSDKDGYSKEGDKAFPKLLKNTKNGTKYYQYYFKADPIVSLDRVIDISHWVTYLGMYSVSSDYEYLNEIHMVNGKDKTRVYKRSAAPKQINPADNLPDIIR